MTADTLHSQLLKTIMKVLQAKIYAKICQKPQINCYRTLPIVNSSFTCNDLADSTIRLDIGAFHVGLTNSFYAFLYSNPLVNPFLFTCGTPIFFSLS